MVILSINPISIVDKTFSPQGPFSSLAVSNLHLYHTIFLNLIAWLFSLLPTATSGRGLCQFQARSVLSAELVVAALVKRESRDVTATTMGCRSKKRRKKTWNERAKENVFKNTMNMWACGGFNKNWLAQSQAGYWSKADSSSWWLKSGQVIYLMVSDCLHVFEMNMRSRSGKSICYLCETEISTYPTVL